MRKNNISFDLLKNLCTSIQLWKVRDNLCDSQMVPEVDNSRSNSEMCMWSSKCPQQGHILISFNIIILDIEVHNKIPSYKRSKRTLSLSLRDHGGHPNYINYWTRNDDGVLSIYSNLIVTCVFWMFVLNHKPCLTPLKYWCMVKKINHIIYDAHTSKNAGVIKLFSLIIHLNFKGVWLGADL